MRVTVVSDRYTELGLFHAMLDFYDEKVVDHVESRPQVLYGPSLNKEATVLLLHRRPI